ncbi:putative dehydrogenase [Dyadobacter sp. BE34]|jgi:myo-inositol 2-dehydrogenase / D-chiro-inositol 1-dehydrogenase|uniref:Dehydrogenase n=2 Tax=Spirosomataceae TaxID=2896860 RepID=A0ABU1R3P2_9BACT|nr:MULTISPECIES: Gfo/Idh/MocA family oxidoreductase [Dyadobacter]MDR6808032.1 putative dehydrogenase [Dyadobacter fermentans]MDR7046152.1 putative dehydrogenase [Dyadobacter sp. BE242]MDR7200465.1 putative dehydrogenase [Dyadobacter sp. BE34]MDR7218425.1 putative dehydrogenase [Dyadobacter sp. BE31]MDR7266356.1 putative dehydrogenase [Dyadobacter sp. BE32]
MSTSRRDVLKMAGVALAGSTLPTFAILNPNRAFAGVNADTLKVGLIGCGGRGSGAANQALKADPNVVLWAMGDIFKDKMDASLENLTKVHGPKVKVDEGRKFIGFDAFKKVLDSGVDVVLLATPPHFRPEHLTAAINAGKHVFCEKPVAVDAPGVRKVLDAAKLAKQKNVSLMSGFCWRYHEPKRASFARILDGAVGDITAIYNTYDTGTLWSFPRVSGWTDAEYVLRNWTYYTWLAGDHIVEQAVHSIDMMAWAMGGKLPVSAVGTGGRQVRTDSLFGNIFDHFSVVYDYDNGVKGFHHSRQQANCENSYLVQTLGTKGSAMVNCARNVHEITGANPWKYEGVQNDMYQTEHNELFASIRSGKLINDGEFMAHSTLTAIMGRMAAYTGKRITWNEALNSTEKLGPDTYSFDMKPPVVEVAKPGITAFS